MRTQIFISFGGVFKMKDSMREKRSSMLLELEECIKDLLVEYGITGDSAEQISFGVSNFLADNFGGQTFSFPALYHYKIAKRDMEIFEQHKKGLSKSKLAQKYCMSENGIWRCIDRIKKNQVNAARAS